MNDGTLLTYGSRPAVRLERHLEDPPSVVWRALTDREQLRSWFPCDVVVTGGRWDVGATITFHFPPEVIEMTLTGRVLAVDEPNVLAYSWGEEVLRFWPDSIPRRTRGDRASRRTPSRSSRPSVTKRARRTATKATDQYVSARGPA